MKVVDWNDVWYDDETKLNVVRKTFEIDSVNSYIMEKLGNIDFTKTGVLIETGTAQIRIPSEVYDKLKTEVKEALKKESLPPHKTRYSDDRWLKENYWDNCDAYIFEFKYFNINENLAWGYDGLDDYSTTTKFLPYEHDFIGEFIECREKRWGEAGEVENIKKWLKENEEQ